MKKTSLAMTAAVAFWTVLLLVGAVATGAASRDEIDAQKRADERRGYTPVTGVRVTDPRTNVDIRGITAPNLTPEQQKILDDRRRAAQERSGAREARDSQTATPPGPATPAVPSVKLPVPPTQTKPAAPSTGRGSGKNIDVSGAAGLEDPGFLTLFLSQAFPEDSTDTVELTVRMNNSRALAFDTLSFTLEYDPEFLEFVPPASATRTAELGTPHFLEDEADRYELALVRSATAGYLNYVDPDAGLIRYQAHPPEFEPLRGQGPIAGMTFRIKKNIGWTEVRFIFESKDAAPWDLLVMDAARGVTSATPPAYWTSVTEKGEDRLGSPRTWTDGALGVMVYPRRNLAEGRERRSVYIAGDSRKAVPEATPEDLGVRIMILPSSPSVEREEEFDMLIQLENPNRVAFDTLNLFLAYNPSVLLALDHDEDNWIRAGVNVFDGDSRKLFPFDIHLENSIDMYTGLVNYQMRKAFDPLDGEGTLALIRFKAIAPIPATRMKALFHVRGLTPTTGVFRNNKDVLGWSDDLTDGVEFASIEIREREGSLETELPASH